MAKSRFQSVKECLRYLADSRLTDREVWDVVTAFRGPDSGNESLKTGTTRVIRGILFRRLPHASFQAAPVTAADVVGIYAALAKTHNEEHFDRHIRAALRALAKIRKSAREGNVV